MNDDETMCFCGHVMCKYNPHEHNFKDYKEKINYFKKLVEQARADERAKNLESAKRQMDLLVIEMTKKHLDALEEARKQKCQLCQKYKASICVHCHNTEWDEDE